MWSRRLSFGVFFIIITLLEKTQSARILGIFPFSAKSHHIVFSSLVYELAKREHELVVVTPSPPSKSMPNITVIDIMEDISETHQSLVKNNLYQLKDASVFHIINVLSIYGIEETKSVLKSNKIKQLLEDEKGFDLAIVEDFRNEAFYAFADYFKAPLVTISPFGGFHWLNYPHSNPAPYSYVPNPMLPYTDTMKLNQRFFNALFTIIWDINNNYFYLPEQEKLRQQLFGKGGRNVWELSNSISLTLLNNHFSTHYPRPLVPSIVEVGGMHVFAAKNKPLPDKIKAFLDKATNGAIYFSMGSNLQGNLMAVEKVQAFLKAFSELKQYQIIWKWEDNTLEGKPVNVMIGEWLPQLDILAHPNVKLFITHGGLLSIQEAVYNAIPIVGIPVFSDQELNMARAESGGYGLKLDFNNITKESVLWAVNSVLYDSKYLIQSKSLSRVFKDQPETPIKRAIFWIEYIIRHKGAYHLKSAATKLSFYQIYLLDLLFITIFSLIIIIYIGFIIKNFIQCRKSHISGNKKSQ